MVIRLIDNNSKSEGINGLAELYKKQGLKVSDKVDAAQATNEIRDKIMEVTGLAETTVMQYMHGDFKQELNKVMICATDVGQTNM